jgi:ABC-2 type transport system permease protein/sodium transport system permease protein
MNLPSPGMELRRLGRLIRKELSTILRDRRTIITLVLMPLLVYLLLTIAFRQFLFKAASGKQTHIEYKVGFRSLEEQSIFNAQIERGEAILKRQRPEQADSLPVKLIPFESANPEEPLQSGALALGIRVREVGPGPAHLYVCDVLYLRDSIEGLAAKEYVERRLAAANLRFMNRGVPVAEAAGPPVQNVNRPDILEMRSIPLERSAKSETIPLSVLLPLILILMTMTGAVYPAIDLTAGERERGTLEVLVAAPVPRLQLLFAKYVAVLTVAVLTAVVNLVAMTFTLQVNGLSELVFGKAGLPLVAIVQIFGLLLLFASFFSAMLLIVTCFARSFKEAQAYLIPLMLVSMTPGILSLLPGLKLSGAMTVVPLLNIVLLTRDVLEGTANLATGLLVVTATLVYALAAVALAARIFGAEAVLDNEQASWSDLFRRPSVSRSSPTVSSALFCLAIMFPISFILIALLADLAGRGLEVELAGKAGGYVVLFLGIPFLIAWMGRVRFREGFRLTRSAVWFWGGAILLGLSLWPFADVIQRSLRWIGVATFSDEAPELGAETGARFRELSPIVLVVCLGVIPAVFEELFFRGFLLGALLRAMRPRSAILASAAFFGLFHLVDQQLVIIERAVSSTLLGLVLGWLAQRSGSVLPGMILHATHNGCLLLLLYFQPQLIESGWMPAGDAPLPLSYLVAGSVGAIFGLAWMWIAARGGVDRETPID